MLSDALPDERSQRIAVIAAGAVLVVLLLVVGAAAGLALARSGEILPGVRVAGVDVGGLGPTDARAALADVVEARRTDPIHLRVADRSVTVSPEEVGFDVDVEATFRRARRAGRDGSWLATAYHHLDTAWHGPELGLVTTLDDAQLSGWVTRLGDRLGTSPTPGEITVDPETVEVTVTPPRDGVTIRPEPTIELIADALRRPGTETIDVPADTTPTPITRTQVEQVAEVARRALAAPLTLHGGTTTIVLEPADLAPMVALERIERGGQPAVRLHTPIGAVESTFAPFTDQLQVPPVDARFDLGREPPETFDDQEATTWTPVPVDDIDVVPAEDGRRFDAATTARQLGSLLREGTREARLRLERIEPELTTEDLEGWDITHLLGTFTTYHACCQARVTNIHRLADMVDGAIVPPGEQFSVNQISGVRRCSKGFAPAGTIIAGELVDTCGGGVSQFGTTTFNAAFFAGVPIDSYKAHSWYISRYPMGREATLNYPSPDLDVRFTNDTDDGMVVRTAYTPTSITVSIYGSSDLREVEATLGEPYDFTDYTTEVRHDDSLPPGSSRVIQSGDGGFTVQVDRIITYTDGSKNTRTFTTVYTPRRQIVLRNPSSGSGDTSATPQATPQETEGTSTSTPNPTSTDGGSG